MKSKVTEVGHLSFQSGTADVFSKQFPLSDIFTERTPAYINELMLFAARFNAIPNFIHEIEIDCKRANQWFLEHYQNQITDCYYDKLYYNGNKQAEYDDIFYFLYEDLIVDFDTNKSIVRFLFRQTDIAKVECIASEIKKFRKKKARQKPEIHLLIHTKHGLQTQSMQITKPRLSIDDNYNDDFKEIHQTIKRRLSRQNDKGIVLLHGKPGTGKTSYIRYLIASLKKDVIFLPPNMASAITNPDLMSLLIDHPNSIFVIEDAENIVMNREFNGASPVSALLNLSDGLLSDCLNIQIICSFNTDIARIDKALLRKGRLIAKYEFPNLCVEKARILSAKLGFQSDIKASMPLTDIYNQDEAMLQVSEKRKSIGFRVVESN